MGRTPDAFSFLTNQETVRPMGIGDILKDPTLYNLTFGPELQNYDPSSKTQSLTEWLLPTDKA